MSDVKQPTMTLREAAQMVVALETDWSLPGRPPALEVYLQREFDAAPGQVRVFGRDHRIPDTFALQSRGFDELGGKLSGRVAEDRATRRHIEGLALRATLEQSVDFRFHLLGCCRFDREARPDNCPSRSRRPEPSARSKR